MLSDKKVKVVLCSLEARMREVGISYARLASLVGVRSETVQKYSRGKELPRIDIALSIADSLLCPVEDIWEVRIC